MGLMSIRILLLGALLGVLAAACGTSREPYDPPTAPTTPETPTATPVLGTATPVPPATELRVAFINLMHPIALDPDDVEAAQTLERRLAIVIAELQEFQPDIVAVVEASWTREHGDVVQALARELRLEPHPLARANPWLPNFTEEQLAELADQAGYAEGVSVLSRYPILRWTTPHQITPRPSQTENRIVLHLVIKGPDQVGEIDVYVTQLTAGDDESHAQQAADVLTFVASTRGDGAAFIFADLNEPPDSETVATFTTDNLFVDIVGLLEADLPEGTCCRPGVVGEQEPLERRTSYVLTSGWTAESAGLFAHIPRAMADGTPLYASDHNGLRVTFTLVEPGDGFSGDFLTR